MNLYLYEKISIHNRIYNYFHMKDFAVRLRIDRESYEWGLSSRSVDLECMCELHSYRKTATLN